MRSIARAILPKRFRQGILLLVSRVNLIFLRVMGASGISASLYYLFPSSEFRREHQAVLQGRREYFYSVNNVLETSALLRRNIHRLEKGLIMRPRKPVFAVDFIGETVEVYERAAASPGFCPDELKWGRDVIDHYFSIVGRSPKIEAARERYARISCGSAPHEDSFYLPYPRGKSFASDLGYEELVGLFRQRRSVRWYLDKRVPTDSIEKMVHAASWAPSACNRQPFRFLATTEPEKARAIARCAGGTSGFADNLQAIVVVVGDLSAYPFERDRHLIYVDASLATMQLMLAAETLGLSTCPINWPDVARSEAMLRRIVSLRPFQRVIMLVAVGYGDLEGMIPFSQKKGNGLMLDFLE